MIFWWFSLFWLWWFLCYNLLRCLFLRIRWQSLYNRCFIIYMSFYSNDGTVVIAVIAAEDGVAISLSLCVSLLLSSLSQPLFALVLGVWRGSPGLSDSIMQLHWVHIRLHFYFLLENSSVSQAGKKNKCAVLQLWLQRNRASWWQQMFSENYRRSSVTSRWESPDTSRYNIKTILDSVNISVICYILQYAEYLD